MMGDTFIDVFFETFRRVFELWNTELDFPAPLYTTTPFDLTMFFYIASILASMVNHIVTRRGDDT